MKLSVSQIVLLFCWISNANARSNQVKVVSGGGYTISIKKLLCTNSTDIILLDICKFRLMRGKMGQLSFGATFLKQQEIVWMQVRLMQKSSANIYQPTVIDATFNVCEITKSELAMSPLRTLLSMFSPQAMDLMKSFLHRCPYVGRHEVINFTVDTMSVPNFVQTGDAKLIGTVFGDARRFLFEAEVYVYIKTPSLMQIN